ncbi:unnamed protein product [Rhizophagus irregularis]|nr:unnamed protein product [Rhizophagus irregularis]
MDLEIVCSEKVSGLCKKKEMFTFNLPQFKGGDLMEEEFSMRPEFEIIGEESSGRADYEIKEVKSRIKELEEK